ncbi:uncharacterized aarF domain-containing protein kinase 2 isoform X1 [Ornithorhynchus anatinus]|uniref:AarF domain containing kinase 2 n=1 Tax=Ornithorhynchus anatinus TaxID=9258 RepID=A0A6I8PJ83_ORNAN|nr:uncharacterized aarF domain-containing protein kinase 2 isoform X1 [Ornithorhynchus anatinus]
MMVFWRFSARVCLAPLRGFEARRGRGAAGRRPDEAPALRFSQAWPKLALALWGSREDSGREPHSPAGAAPAGTGSEPTGAPLLGRLLRQLGLGLRLGLRACVLLLKFAPLLLAYPLARLSPRLSSLWLRLLLKAAESSGPTYIKLGQWAGTRRDLFSEEFCATFSRLHVRAAPHPWAHTELVLRGAVGEDWRRALRFDSEEPVGAGCVAQVYKAYVSVDRLEDPRSGSGARPGSGLRGLLGRLWAGQKLEGAWPDPPSPEAQGAGSPPGRNPSPPPACGAEPDHRIPVAVKVLHPGLAQKVHIDLLLMKMGSRVLGLLPGVKWLSLTEILEEFEKLMIQQIDLRYEAWNLERFHHNFRHVDFVRFPTPLRPFVTSSLLVETFEESVPVSSYLPLAVPPELKRKIARLGIDMLLKMVFVDNLVHADLHPGNILVQGGDSPGGSRVDRPGPAGARNPPVAAAKPPAPPLRLVLLDAGIVAELQEADRENFRAVFRAVVLGQGERVAELILHHARASECRDVERFKAEMADLVTRARENTVSLGKLQVADLLSSVFKLLMTHKVKLESNFASMVLAIMVLEGLGRSLDPGLNILEAAKPLLIRNSTAAL